MTREQLFGADVNPVGEVIRISNQPFTVVGVMAAKGQSQIGQDRDDVAFAPYTTVMKKLRGVTFINNVNVMGADSSQVSATADRIAALLRTRHKIQPGDPDDFMVRTIEEMASVRKEATQTMTALLASIAGVSLLVGGIGIMNIMLVSVTERTREIGLRMAIGARGRDVLLQFLVEAVVAQPVRRRDWDRPWIWARGRGHLVAGLAHHGIAELRSDSVRVRGSHRRVLWVLPGAQGRCALDPIEALRFE